jgi:hypothetical protein
MARIRKSLALGLQLTIVAAMGWMWEVRAFAAEVDSTGGAIAQTESRKLQAKVQAKVETAQAGTVGAQQPASSDVATLAPQKGDKGKGAKAAEQEHLLRTIRALPREKKKQLLENLKAWQMLSDEQKQALRDRDVQLRTRASEEAAAAIADANLSPEQADLFQKRYVEERRKVEASLKHELELRRKSEIEGITRRLRQEIQSPEPPRTP